MNYSRPVFLLFSSVFIETMLKEPLCPSVDDKKQEGSLRSHFFEYQIKILQLLNQSRDVKIEVTTVAPSTWYMEASEKNVF